MRYRICFLACLLIGWPTLATAQTIKNPADVMPAKAIGYIELRNPGQLIKEVQSLFEGSVLSNPAALAKLQEKFKTSSFRRGPEEIQAASLLLAPEIPAEIGRIQGAAVAITGIDKNDHGMPEFVAVILPGDSNILRLAFRAFPLAFMSGHSSSDGKTRIEGISRFESVGEVEGVRIYRMRTRERRTSAEGGDAGKETVRDQGPALAMLPDALLVGSLDNVKEVIGRAKRTITTPALSNTRGYQEASKGMGERPGIFSLGDVKSLLAAIEQFPLPPAEKGMLDSIMKLVNPAALESVSQTLSLSNGTLQFRWRAQLDPKEKSRILDLLPASGINPEMLHFAPRDATVLLAVSNADGEQRLSNLLTLADEIHRAAGDRHVPSEELQRLEQMIGAKIGKDILGRIHSVAVAVKAPGGISDLTPPPMVVVVQGTNEAAAKALAEQTIPHFYGLIMKTPDLKPDSQEVQGHTVYSVPFVSYGRHGSTLVIATKTELVADALTSGVKKQGLLSDEKFAGRLAKSEGTVVFLAAKPLNMAAKSLPFGLMFMPAQEKAIASKLVAPIQQLAKSEEPIVLHVTRTPDAVMAEFTVAGLKDIVPKAVDVGVEMFYQMSARYGQRSAPPESKSPRSPEARPKERQR